MPNRNFNLTNSMGNLCTDIMGALKANQVSDEEKLHISDKQGYTICIGDDNIGYVSVNTKFKESILQKQ